MVDIFYSRCKRLFCMNSIIFRSNLQACRTVVIHVLAYQVSEYTCKWLGFVNTSKCAYRNDCLFVTVTKQLLRVVSRRSFK